MNAVEAMRFYCIITLSSVENLNTDKMQNNRSLVISLIKEDLRCNKLVLGLSDLGLDAGKYHTELSAVVFQLMKLDHSNDALLQLYFECIDRATMIDDVEDTKRMLAAAEEILEKVLDAAKE